MLLVAVVLAVLAGGTASSAGTPGIRAVQGHAVKGRMSILGREARHARGRSSDLRQTPNMLGRMPVPAGKQTTSPSRLAGTQVLGPLLPSTPGSVNVDGMNSTEAPGWDPPDTNGDVGPDHFVQIVNMNWEVFDKSGQSLGGPFDLNALWAKQPSTDPCNGTPRGDPTIVYDPIEDRWLMSYFAFGADGFGLPASPFYQCLAVSLTGDPLGYWWLYDMDMTPLTQVVDGGFTPGFPDYPKLTVWPDGYYMSANLFWPEPDYNQTYAMGVAFEKDQMMAGQYARWRGFVVLDRTQTTGGMLPADFEGTAANAPPDGTPNPFVAQDANVYQLRVYQFDGNWSGDYLSPAIRIATPGITTYDPTVCADSNGLCIPQPGTALKLPAVDHDQLMYRAAYRKVGTHESLVVNQTVDAGSGVAGIQWFELRGVTGASPTVFTEGTWSPDTTHRWMGSASIDKAGNIGVGYNVSDAASVNPGIRYAGLTASGDTGGTGKQFDVPEATLVNGGGHRTGDNGGNGVRWGDYSSMSVDPVDGCTFWFTGEYLPGNVVDAWSTRIGTFRIPSGACGTANKLPAASFTLGANPATAGVSVHLDGSASSDPDGTVQSYQWDFDGDGTTDQTTGTNSTDHTYTLAGTYLATLRVVDNLGGASSTTRSLTVQPGNGNTPPGDPRDNPVALGGKTQLSNVNATLAGGETKACSQFTTPSQYGKTVWLSYHAATSGTLTVRSSGFDTVMALYHGSDTTPLTCNDDDAQQAPGPSRISRRVAAGDYMVQVGGFDNGGGGLEGVLTMTEEFTQNAAPTAVFTNSNAIAHHAVSFDGSGSSDSDGTIARYEWDLDGDGSFETDSGTTATTSRSYDSAATVNVKLRVTDNDGDTSTIAHDVTVASPVAPTAKLTASPNPALAGRTVTFDGSGSADASHTITKYEWDLDGNGSYERDTGGSATTTNAYAAPGSYVIGLRVTDSDGLQGTTTTTLTVSAPPDNNTLFGVTIDNEATYTRTPKVTLGLRFPAGVTSVIVSNDGGFLHPATFDPKKEIDWDLVSTGPERLPKVVYVRFATGPFIGQNYTDDIILDEKPPVVEQAAVAPAAASSVAARASKLGKWKVKLKATDSNSGVAGVQVTASKKKPGKLLKYRKKLTVKSAKRPKFVRARDKAGNLSKWKKAR